MDNQLWECHHQFATCHKCFQISIVPWGDITPKLYSLAGVEDLATISAGVLAPQLMNQLHVGPQTHLENNSFSMMITFKLLPGEPKNTLFRNSLLQRSQVDLSLPPWLPMWRLKALGSLHFSPSWLLTDQLSWLVLIFVCFITNIKVRNRKAITNPHYRCYRRAETCSFWWLFVSLFHNKYQSGK